jgi:hypothetical protein
VVGIVTSHVFTHNGSSVLGDIQASAKAILHDHASSIFGADSTPGATKFSLNGADVFKCRGVRSHDVFLLLVGVLLPKDKRISGHQNGRRAV